jgi:NodT family efflux transporter outer membrane factor (OMF) lipoprotein
MAFAALATAAACTTVGPDYERPELETGSGWMDRQGIAAPDGAFIAWWRDLGDPELTRLVEAALDENLSVRQALSRIDEARARRGTVRANRLPSVSADASVNVIEQSRNASPGIDQIPGFERRFEQYDVGASLSWQLDLWGQISRHIESADARLAASVAAANGARLSVAIETASTYLSMRGFQGELAALNESIAAQQRLVELSQDQLEFGQIARADLVLVESELAGLEAQVPSLETEILAAALSLSVLTGQLPEAEADLSSSDSASIALRDIPVGLRASVLQRRPDIVRLERELASQTADIGVAHGELFPKLSLNLSGAFTSVSPDTLLDGASRNTSILPLISWRIFDGGRVRAEIRLAEAEARTAALEYEEAVLTALSEAETAIARYERARETLRRTDRSVALAQENAELAEIRFEEGEFDRLRLQDALRNLNDAERARAQAYRAATLSMTQLYAALGGGWQAPDHIRSTQIEENQEIDG